MVRLIISLVTHNTADAKRQEEALHSLARAARLEKGCLHSSVRIQEGEKFTVHYNEEWATEEDLRRRVRSARFTTLLALLETAAEPPHIQFDFVTTTSGLEYVAAVRDQAW